MSDQQGKSSPYRFQLSLDMTLDAALRGYRALTFPPIDKRAQGHPLHEPLVSVIAWQQQQLVAMALAEVKPTREAEIISLYVVPAHRQRGLGTALLHHLERALRRVGCTSLHINYRSDWPALATVERMLAGQGWNAPQDFRLLCKTNHEQILAAPEFHGIQLAPGFSFFAWAELTNQERHTIQERQHREEWYLPVLSPFQAEARQEPLNSLGLRHAGEIVGWLITHRINADTIEYSSLFVQPGRRLRAQAPALVREALARQVAAGVPDVIFQVDADNFPMQRFLNRRLRPYLTLLTKSRVCSKLLV